MIIKGEKGGRKKNFSNEEVKLLIELVSEKSAIINSHKTNNSQPRIIKNTWEEITASYNANQTSGARTVEELKIKYKNVKATTKKNVALNKIEMRKTGGGIAELTNDNEFGFNFAKEQISGLENKFDSDEIEPPKSVSSVVSLENEDTNRKKNEICDSQEYKSTLEFPATKKKFQGKQRKLLVESDDVSNTKQKIYEQQSELLALQILNMKLRNTYIKVKIEKLNVKEPQPRIETPLNYLISDHSSSDDGDDDE